MVLCYSEKWIMKCRSSKQNNMLYFKFSTLGHFLSFFNYVTATHKVGYTTETILSWLVKCQLYPFPPTPLTPLVPVPWLPLPHTLTSLTTNFSSLVRWVRAERIMYLTTVLPSLLPAENGLVDCGGGEGAASSWGNSN